MRRFHLDRAIWGRSLITAREQSRFFLHIDALLPPRHRACAMELLRTVVPQQRWGIGQVIPAGWTAYFKGGWGSGIGLVDHQVALLTARPGARVGGGADVTNGTHKTGKATLRGVFARLLRGLADERLAARASSAATSAGSSASGGCSARKRSASRRPPSARRPRAPCSATKSASAPQAAGADARRRRGRARSRWASSAAISSSIAAHRVHARDRERPACRLAERAQRGAQVATARRGDRAEVGLRHHEHVGHLHDPGLQELQRVAGARLDDDRDGVGHLGHLGLRLPDADGLDHHHVERRRQRLRGGAGGGGEAAEPLARRPSSG